MDLKHLAESLNPQERKLLPLLKSSQLRTEITSLKKDELLRAIQLLENKKIVTTKTTIETIYEKTYKHKYLPEIRFLKAIEKNPLNFNEIKAKAELDQNEFSVSMGGLKRNGCIGISQGKSSITSIGKKYLKESNSNQRLLGALPKKESELKEEELEVVKKLLARGKNVLIKETERKLTTISLTKLGKDLQKTKLQDKLIEVLTPSIIKNYKNEKFRRYDIQTPVPKIYAGKRHFVNQATQYAKRIWLDLGFKEMTGNHIQSSFWNFDALFTAQDHPVREMQDTFFMKDRVKTLPKKYTTKVKKAHEGGVCGSKGWQYSWNEEEAKTQVLRTHTTSLSALTLASLKKEDLPAKFFALGKCYRNEAVDWSHAFEFNQTEGIVVDPDANFRHLLGYLKEFFRKIGYPKARFRPAYFPYTEMSVEIDIFHPTKKTWLELGGAGIFRPEVVKPLLGIDVPVLAWGPGFDRIILEYYQIKDIRELYKNDLKQLRESKLWLK